ncbi:MAG: GGDEF domain-containing protein [Anaerolineae bacterium]|nr:GGDEF domain-containing protein [Anaerolineae bacterium]
MKRTEPQQVREELEQLLTQASATADRDGHSLSLILLDVDEFRKVNEMYGHSVGDQVLADLARIVPQHIRKQDTFVRCGGEEYAIVAPGMALAETETMAETIRSAVENHVFPEAGRVTISLGLIAYRAGDMPVDMIEHVYKAVGQAKASGRNRVQVAS